MPGERQLFRDREDAYLLPLPRFNVWIARQDESCLRKIHLTRNRLHFPLIQSARVGKNGERITGQRCLREHIKLDEFVSAVRHKNLFSIQSIGLPFSASRERPYHNLPDQDTYSDPPFRADVSFSSLSRSDRPFRLSCVARVLASGGMPESPCQIRGRDGCSHPFETRGRWL